MKLNFYTISAKFDCWPDSLLFKIIELSHKQDGIVPEHKGFKKSIVKMDFLSFFVTNKLRKCISNEKVSLLVTKVNFIQYSIPAHNIYNVVLIVL